MLGQLDTGLPQSDGHAGLLVQVLAQTIRISTPRLTKGAWDRGSLSIYTPGHSHWPQIPRHWVPETKLGWGGVGCSQHTVPKPALSEWPSLKSSFQAWLLSLDSFPRSHFIQGDLLLFPSTGSWPETCRMPLLESLASSLGHQEFRFLVLPFKKAAYALSHPFLVTKLYIPEISVIRVFGNLWAVGTSSSCIGLTKSPLRWLHIEKKFGFLWLNYHTQHK